MENKYELRYLPLFYDDMLEKVSYISQKLQNPKAADDLINDVEAAILKRLPDCESFEPYHSLNDREYPYYRIYVRNYIVFYVVIAIGNKKIMEVRRFLYKGQDRDNLV